MADLHINNKKKRYTKEEEQIIIKHYPDLDLLEKLLSDRNRKNIILKAMYLGLSKKNNPKWTDQEIDIIKKYYPMNGSNFIQQNLLPHRSISEIRQKAFKLGVKFSTYNENYFEKIDTIDKAYFLGLFYTDGYVTNKTNRVGIELNIKDKYILEELLKCLDSNLNVKERKRKNSFDNNKNIYVCSILINNKKLHTDLINLGCLPSKSKIIKLPNNNQVPEKFFWHFLRGVIDGDGSIGLYNCSDKKYKKPHISICSGSKDFIYDLHKKLKSYGFDLIITKKNNLYRLISEKQDIVFGIINKLYKDSKNFKLLRKYKNTLDICNYFNIQLDN